MKKLSLSLFVILLTASCQKKKKIYSDNLLVVKNEEINVLIRKYKNYEKSFVEAMKKENVEKIKAYSDSANYYDKLLFDKVTMGKLDPAEKNKFSEQINNIRKEKMNELTKISPKK